ncbi:hypothetical protein CPB85DRAFT_1437918 [Mucidula mucida]|nr:hypothetical protein CPB85DRAFT_1437918 [Mucidula mucida]
MSSSFDDFGVTVSDVQGLFSSYLHSRILFVLCHAIHTCIFVVALYYIVESRLDRKQLAFAIIITFLWCSDTVIMGMEWRDLDNLLIRHGESLQSEFDHYMFDYAITPMATNVLRGLDVILADMVLIWRCWTMYGHNWKLAVGPSLFLITETISFIFILLSDSDDDGWIGLATVNWVLVYYTMTVVTNTVCTALILYRMLRFNDAGVSIRTYRGIIELLVESAVVYSLIYITLLVVYAYEFYTPDLPFMRWYFYPQVLSWSITGITPTLIIIRAMAGHNRANMQPSILHAKSMGAALLRPKTQSGGELITADIQVDLEAARNALTHEELQKWSSEVMIIENL